MRHLLLSEGDGSRGGAAFVSSSVRQPGPSGRLCPPEAGGFGLCVLGCVQVAAGGLLGMGAGGSSSVPC